MWWNTDSLGMIHCASKDARKTVMRTRRRRKGCIEDRSFGDSITEEGGR